MRSFQTAVLARPVAFLLVVMTGMGAGCTKKKGPQGGFSMPPTPVETATVEARAVADRFETVGTLEAGDRITVVAEIDGTIRGLPFPEGGAIARGGLIASLDDAQLAAEAARAEALRDQSRSVFERVKAVVDQGAGAPQDLDDAAASLKVAEANLAVARVRLAKTRIVAPFDGIAGARRVSPGAFVRSGQEITDLARIEELRVAFNAPERYIGKLARGASLTVSTTAYPGRTLTGSIDVIEPVLDSATRSARVVARVRNPGNLFRPGMSASITVVLSERAAALTVPNEAVFVEGDQAFVYVVGADSTVARAAVTLGTRLPDVVEVLDGIAAGTRVVRTGHQKLYPGAKVFPVGGGGPSSGAPETTEREAR